MNISGNLHRVQTGVDVVPVLTELASQPHLWRENTTRQDYEGSFHKHTEAIFLRWAKDQTVEGAFTDLEAVDYPAFEKLPSVRPILAKLISDVGATKVGRVMLVNLRAGGYIPKHSDEGAYADHYERFHLVIKEDAGNEFYVEQTSEPEVGQLASMKTGEAWYFNHKQPHWVYNGSNSGRIHLIVDAVAPKFRKERILQ